MNRQTTGVARGKGSGTRHQENLNAYREGYAKIFGDKNGLTKKDNEVIEDMIQEIKDAKTKNED